jgi:hypothetical protein
MFYFDLEINPNSKYYPFMKKIIIFIIFASITKIAYSQTNQPSRLKFGLKVGGNAGFGNQYKKDYEESDGLKFGFVAGMFANIKLSSKGLYIRPEAIFTQQGTKKRFLIRGYHYGMFDQFFYEETSFTTLEFPLLLSQKMGKKNWGIRLNGGPDFVTILSANKTVNTLEENNFKDKIHTFQIALQVGVGLDIYRFGFDVRYQHNFTKLYRDDKYISISPDMTLNTIQASISCEIF